MKQQSLLKGRPPVGISWMSMCIAMSLSVNVAENIFLWCELDCMQSLYLKRSTSSYMCYGNYYHWYFSGNYQSAIKLLIAYPQYLYDSYIIDIMISDYYIAYTLVIRKYRSQHNRLSWISSIMRVQIFHDRPSFQNDTNSSTNCGIINNSSVICLLRVLLSSSTDPW